MVRGTDQLDERMSSIRTDITIALGMNDSPPLGLEFASDMEEGVAEAPEIDPGAEQPTGRQRTTWRVRYRRSRTDPTTG